MNLSADYTQDPQQNINLVQILIKRKLIEPFVSEPSSFFLPKFFSQEKLSKENVECYNLERGSLEGKPQYFERVNKCLDSWQRHFERVENSTNQYLSKLREKEVAENFLFISFILYRQAIFQNCSTAAMRSMTLKFKLAEEKKMRDLLMNSKKLFPNYNIG